MESIEQMIKRLCPEGVKYVKLGDICEIRRGVRVVKKQLGDGAGYPVYQNSLTSLGMYESSNRKPGTTFVICAGAAGEIGFCNSEFWAADDCSSVESEVLADKFIYYYLMTQQNKLKSQVRKASVPRLSRDAIENLSIPLPPLEIQNRIVEVLDKMTTLTAELEAELEARKQQYEYYRNKLLTFNKLGGGKQVTWKKISEIGTVMRGKRLTKKMLSEENKYPVYHGGLSPIGKYSMKNRNANTVMIINVGASAGTVGFCDTDFWSSDGCFCLDLNNSVMPKYVYYALAIKQHLIQSRVRKAGIPTLDASAVEDINIPVFPLEEQARIVSILDRFEALTTDLQIGLPAEIEARRQQYEYYRNKLLTFDAA